MPSSDSVGRRKLSMGEMHGVTRDSTFEFYRSLADLSRKANPLGVATVESVDFATCVVRLPKNVTLPTTAKARLDAVRMQEFSVRVAGKDLPRPMVDALAKMDSNGQLQLAGEKSPYDVAVWHDASSKTVRLFSPAALPDPARKTQPRPLHEFRYATPEAGAKQLSQCLLRIARVQRLMTLSCNSDEVAPRIRAVRGKPLPAVTRTDGDAVTLIREGSEFEVHITNNTGQAAYVTLLTFDSSVPGKMAELSILYPQPNDAGMPIAPGKVLKIKNFFASAGRPVERTSIKVLLTSSYVDFYPIVNIPPSLDVKATRGAIEAGQRETRSGELTGEAKSINECLTQILHGTGSKDADASSLTRGAVRRRGGRTNLATQTILFDVAKDKAYRDLTQK
jgi:hypothetical protein